MISISDIRIDRGDTEAMREAALDVLHATYVHEKSWATDATALFPASDLGRDDVLWLVARVHDRPVGTMRVTFDPVATGYADYRLEFVEPALNAEAFLRDNRIAEIGRFAVLPMVRGNIMPPAALMRSATLETVGRGYTHFVTDVLEDDPHSPYKFHTRVLGFQTVATHQTGELLSSSRRITLVLDIKAAYHRHSAASNWFSRYLVSDWEEPLRRQVAA
jgi:hypothetical protein